MILTRLSSLFDPSACRLVESRSDHPGSHWKKSRFSYLRGLARVRVWIVMASKFQRSEYKKETQQIRFHLLICLYSAPIRSISQAKVRLLHSWALDLYLGQAPSWIPRIQKSRIDHGISDSQRLRL